MTDRRSFLAAALAAMPAIAAIDREAPKGDPLPSWNDGATKKAVLGFVRRVTDKSGREWVPPAERIAVFDNDGTLWCEHPMYVQLAFALARVKALAPKHPEWKEKQPFKAVLEGDMKALAAAGRKGAW